METKESKIYLLHNTALIYLKTKEKTEEEVIYWLTEQEVSEKKSKIVVIKLQNQILRHKRGNKINIILSGLFICGIGILFTTLNTGYIWWGAIIFGGIQFIRGLSMETE